MGGPLPLLLISFLLVAVDGGESLAKLSDEAIANPAELKAYWGATLPNTPMPQAILDMLALQEDGKSEKEQSSKDYGDATKMGKLFFYNKGGQVDADDSTIGKLFFYKEDQQNDGEESRIGKLFFYNNGVHVDGDESKIGKLFLYNYVNQVDGDESKMGELFLYNHGQHVNGDDSNTAKLFFYNQGAQVDGDVSKIGKLFFYNHRHEVDGKDSKMDGKSEKERSSKDYGDDTKMGKLFFYNKDGQVDADGSTMGQLFFYKKGQQNDGEESKIGKLFFYNNGVHVDGDESKIGKLFLYNYGNQVDGDESKMGELFFYNHGQHVNGDTAKLFFYNQGAQVDGDVSKIGKLFLYNHGQQVDGGEESKMGAERKHIHSHGHNHVRLPKAAQDFFFFEKSLAAGTTRSTLILSTRLNPPFLRHEASKRIPFSPRNLTSIIAMLAPASLAMADDMSFTLHQCEGRPEQRAAIIHGGGEKAGCAASMESYLDLVVSTLGTSQVRAFSADVPKEGVVSRRYTTASVRLLARARSVLVCHDMAYPYKVFYCHVASPARAYQVKLVSQEEGGGPPSSMDALAVCHLNTSSWDADHAFFKLMRVAPGQTTACHYLNRGSMVWVATAELNKQAAAQDE